MNQGPLRKEVDLVAGVCSSICSGWCLDPKKCCRFCFPSNFWNAPALLNDNCFFAPGSLSHIHEEWGMWTRKHEQSEGNLLSKRVSERESKDEGEKPQQHWDGSLKVGASECWLLGIFRSYEGEEVLSRDRADASEAFSISQLGSLQFSHGEPVKELAEPDWFRRDANEVMRSLQSRKPVIWPLSGPLRLTYRWWGAPTPNFRALAGKVQDEFGKPCCRSIRKY